MIIGRNAQLLKNITFVGMEILTPVAYLMSAVCLYMNVCMFCVCDSVLTRLYILLALNHKRS